MSFPSLLWLCVSEDDKVWFSENNTEPMCSQLSMKRFCESLPAHLGSDRTLRILALPRNVPLLLWCYDNHEQLGFRLQVASPLVCHNNIERRSPEIVLFRMRQCLLPASLGGWHEFTSRDCPSYDLHVCPNHASLLQHPAWYALSFLNADPASTSFLLGRLLDPRWFIDLRFPERAAKLESFLGLWPKMQYAVTHETTISSGHFRRCRAVYYAWRSGLVEPPKSLEAPGRFLWRVWQEAGEGHMGDLRAAQAFVTYLRYTWLAALCGGPESGFVPEYFFRTETECQAYREHEASRPA